MINIEPSPNSIHISTVQTSCINVEFDSTYPTPLNGIISPEEFTKSMHKINHAVMYKRKTLTFLRMTLTVSIIVGVTLIIISAIKRSSNEDGTSLFLPLSISAIVVSAVGSIIYIISFCIIQYKRNKRMKQAVAEESMKYSSRSPISCSWRLEENYLLIDINHWKTTKYDNQVFQTNQIVSPPTSFYEK